MGSGAVWGCSGEFTSPNGSVKPPPHQAEPLSKNEQGAGWRRLRLVKSAISPSETPEGGSRRTNKVRCRLPRRVEKPLMGGAYVPTPFVGMYAPVAPIRATTCRRHAKERPVATRVFQRLSRAEGPWGQTSRAGCRHQPRQPAAADFDGSGARGTQARGTLENALTTGPRASTINSAGRVSPQL